LIAHKYQTGQDVQFWPPRLKDIAAGELYVIVRLLPVEGGNPQYHIKAKASRMERVVRESQITPYDPDVAGAVSARKASVRRPTRTDEIPKPRS
jgi:hypothetical protein